MQSETAARNTRLDTHSGVSLRALQPGIEGSVCVEPKLKRDRSATQRLEKTYRYLSYITGQCRARTLCGHVSSVVSSGIPTNVRGRQGSTCDKVRSKQNPRRSNSRPRKSWGSWKCHSCKAWSSNSRSQCFSCGVSKEGQELVREHVNAQPDAGSNTTRQQSLSTPSMPVGTETEEPVRGKTALKKHLQRSIDKLVAAREQLPEEEGREVAQGITDRIKALQLQKDGLMSVAARRKKAFAQLEESEKTLESKRKTLQQAQEASEEARQKHAAAQEAMCKRGTGNRRRGRRRQGDARRGAEQNKGSLPRLVQLVRLCSTVKRVTRDAHSDLADLRHSCSSVKNLPPCCCGSWYDGATAADSCTAARCTCGGTASCEGPTEPRLPGTPKQLSTVPEQEQVLLGTTPVGNSAEDVTNALNPFRSISERLRPY